MEGWGILFSTIITILVVLVGWWWTRNLRGKSLPVPTAEKSSSAVSSPKPSLKKEDVMRRKSLMGKEEVTAFSLSAARGSQFLKFGRHGKPHTKTVSIVDGELRWGSSSKRKLVLKDITSILETCETAVFTKSSNSKLADPALCFSLVTATRTLDLMAKDPNEKTLWVEGLRGLLSDEPLETTHRVSFNGNMEPISACPNPDLNLSSAQKNMCEGFRAAAKAHETFDAHKGKGEFIENLSSERFCARWLIARNWNMEKAIVMWSNAVQWRAANGIDKLIDEPYPELPKMEAVMGNNYMHGTDKLGRPLHIEHVGRLDVDKVLAAYDIDTVVRMKVHLFEFKKKVLMNFKEEDTRKGKKGINDQTCAIVDLKGMSMQQFNKTTLNFLQQISKINQDYNPELMGRMFIINAPFFFAMIWKIVKGFLHERTRSKISIIRGPAIEELLAEIDPSHLPTFLGGSCECPGGCDSGSGQNQKLYWGLCENGAVNEAEKAGGWQQYRDSFV